MSKSKKKSTQGAAEPHLVLPWSKKYRYFTGVLLVASIALVLAGVWCFGKACTTPMPDMNLWIGAGLSAAIVGIIGIAIAYAHDRNYKDSYSQLDAWKKLSFPKLLFPGTVQEVLALRDHMTKWMRQQLLYQSTLYLLEEAFVAQIIQQEKDLKQFGSAHQLGELEDKGLKEFRTEYFAAHMDVAGLRLVLQRLRGEIAEAKEKERIAHTLFGDAWKLFCEASDLQHPVQIVNEHKMGGFRPCYQGLNDVHRRFFDSFLNQIGEKKEPIWQRLCRLTTVNESTPVA